MGDENENFVECKVCEKFFRTLKDLKQHEKGKKHLKKLESGRQGDEEVTIHCNDCDLDCSGAIPYQQHLKGNAHKKNLRQKTLIDEMKNKNPEVEKSMKTKDETAILPQSFAVCETCNKDFSGPEPYSQHLASGVHKKKEIELKLQDLLHIKVATKNPKPKIQSLALLLDSEFFATQSNDETVLCCDICEKSFSGAIPYAQHLLSPGHSDKLEEKKDCDRILRELKDVRELVGMNGGEEDEVLSCLVCKVAFSGLVNLRDHFKSKKHIQAIELLEFKKQRDSTETAGKNTKLPEVFKTKSSEEVIKEPGVGKPGKEEPGVKTPGTEEPGVKTPGTEEPGVSKPGTEEPSVRKSGKEEPGVRKPGTEEPGVKNPGTEEPGVSKPGTEEPGVKTPGTEESGDVESSRVADDSNTTSVGIQCSKQSKKEKLTKPWKNAWEEIEKG